MPSINLTTVTESPPWTGFPTPCLNASESLSAHCRYFDIHTLHIHTYKTYMQNIHTHTHIFKHSEATYTYTYILDFHTHIHRCHMQSHTRTMSHVTCSHKHIHIFTCIYTTTYVLTYPCVYMYTSTLTYWLCIFTCVHTHICIIHIHIYIFWWLSEPMFGEFEEKRNHWSSSWWIEHWREKGNCQVSNILTHIHTYCRNYSYKILAHKNMCMSIYEYVSMCMSMSASMCIWIVCECT